MEAIDKWRLATYLDPTLLQAWANQAAFRLILAENDPNQYARAYYDCCEALELSPNYTKAIYRRGLALAGMKLWQRAIIGSYSTDFGMIRILLIEIDV